MARLGRRTLTATRYRPGAESATRSVPPIQCRFPTSDFLPGSGCFPEFRTRNPAAPWALQGGSQVIPFPNACRPAPRLRSAGISAYPLPYALQRIMTNLVHAPIWSRSIGSAASAYADSRSSGIRNALSDRCSITSRMRNPMTLLLPGRRWLLQTFQNRCHHRMHSTATS